MRTSRLVIRSLFWAALVLGGPGCAEKEGPSRHRRVEVAKTKALNTTVQNWCEKHFTADRAPAFHLPPAQSVQGGRPPGVGPDGWVWLNLWATWCKPCLREMPLIQRFSEQLRADGLPLQNWYLSLDEDAAVLSRFLRAHPELSGVNSFRIDNPDQIQEWMTSYGLPAETSIPVSVLRGPDHKVRCIRTGSIHDGDYPMVKSALQ